MSVERRKYKKGEIRLELGERASYRFSILSARQVASMAGVYLKQFALTGNTWRVLSVIGYYAPMSATEVCKHASLEPDKVTRAVDILNAKGYVNRRQDPRDRRKVVLSLSKEGKRIYDEIERIRYIMEREMLGVLTPAEREMLYTILDKLEARAEEILVGKDWLRETLGNSPVALAARQTAAKVRSSDTRRRRTAPRASRHR